MAALVAASADRSLGRVSAIGKGTPALPPPQGVSPVRVIPSLNVGARLHVRAWSRKRDPREGTQDSGIAGLCIY